MILISFVFVLLNHLVNWISEGRAPAGQVLPGTVTADPISLSSCSACCVWKRSTISITLRRLISLAMAAPIPFDSLGTTATFSARFFVFIVIPFVVGFLTTVYRRSRADLTIHISESWLVGWHLTEAIRTRDILVFCLHGFETEFGNMHLDQIGKKQVRKQR